MPQAPRESARKARGTSNESPPRNVPARAPAQASPRSHSVSRRSTSASSASGCCRRRAERFRRIPARMTSSAWRSFSAGSSWRACSRSWAKSASIATSLLDLELRVIRLALALTLRGVAQIPTISRHTARVAAPRNSRRMTIRRTQQTRRRPGSEWS